MWKEIDPENQPWTCLCFGSDLQMTRSLPLRRTTWHELHIFLTLALTFTVNLESDAYDRRSGPVITRADLGMGTNQYRPPLDE